MQENSDEWNMNLRWLDYLIILIMRYGEARMEDDYDGMYKALRLLETTISPKVDKDSIEKNLDIIWDNLGRMETKDQQGRIIRCFPTLIRSTIKLMEETYALLLAKLEEKGILTNKAKDPSKAMGQFGGS